MECEFLKAKPVISRLKYLIGKYVEDLNRADDEGYTGSYSIFEFDEPLYCALFKTEYAANHLDYEFFDTVINYLIVDCGVRDPEEVFNRLLEYVRDTTHTRNWVSIFPIRFNSFLHIGKKLKGITRIGRFRLVAAVCGYSELKKFLADEFGCEKLCDEQYSYMVSDKFSNGALQKDAFIAFEALGSTERRDLNSVSKFNYFCRIFEVFSAASDATITPMSSTAKNISHAFFVNKNDGSLDYLPLTRYSRFKYRYSEAFSEFSKKNDFEYFSNRIFYSADAVFARIRSAMYFFSKGINGSDKVMSFLCYIIAIEALFSNSERFKIKETLSCYISKLCYPESKQEEYSGLIKRLYKQRSEIVHCGKFTLEEDTLDDAISIAATAIIACLKLHRDLQAEGNQATLEARFFKRLKALSLMNEKPLI